MGRTGGVEGEIGRFRRRHLIPVPKVTSLAALNTLITAADLGDETWVITGRRYAGRRLTIRLSACVVEVSDGGKVVARHERAVGKHTEVLTKDHYLEVLKSKPGGLPGATALARRRPAGCSPPSTRATGTPPGGHAATPPAPAR